MQDVTLYVNFDYILATIWNACTICVRWLETHGLRITINGHTSELSFFTLILSGTYIMIACYFLPILHDLASDTYHPLSGDEDDEFE